LKIVKISAWLLIWMLGFTTGISAQDEEATPPKWSGDAALSLSLSRGNSDNINLSFTVNANGKLSEKIEWVNSLLFLFGQAEKLTNTETFQLASRINWTHSGRFFSYYDVQAIRDRLKNYSYRILPGIGAGYKVVANKTVTLALSGGLAEVFTRYHDSQETASFLGIVLGNQFIWKISKTSEFNQKWEWNFDTSEPEHFLSNLEANLITNLIKNWSVKLTVLNRHDSQPVGEGVKKNDFSFLAGISLKF
jgi:putative salt-induced outer membrane protein YdiY